MNSTERRIFGDRKKFQRSSEVLPTYISGDTVRFYETYPREGRDPERPPIIFANGWGSGHAIMHDAAEVLAGMGEHSVTIDYPRSTLCEGNTLLPRQAALQTVMDHLLDKYGRPLHIVGHSTGGIDSVRVMNLYRQAGMLDAFQGLTLVASAGMIEDSTDSEVVGGAIREAIAYAKHPISLLRSFPDLSRVGLEMLGHARLFKAEAKEVIHTHIVAELLQLATAEDCPDILYLPCQGDLLYDRGRLQQSLGDALEGSCIRMQPVDATHTDLSSADPKMLAIVQRHVSEAGERRAPVSGLLA